MNTCEYEWVGVAFIRHAQTVAQARRVRSAVLKRCAPKVTFAQR